MKLLLAVMFLSGLALAGSDGTCFPWPNLAGVGLLAVFAAGIRRCGGGAR